MRTIDKIKQPLALRPPKVTPATKCAVEVATLFNCWRAMSVDHVECKDSAKALMACMATLGKRPSGSKSTEDINYWLKKSERKKHL
ncbi:hypothetical protein HDU85_005378 [Gaertneriomyces sp. JEL0708]|nr:hypothetical protein BC832DRAFT_590884 [Gaertneriomyces semiglobifer]KAJ3188228.1 hypothetical protein HDU85_005378 [Gaertneriomyces sp. JEL0708]